MAGYTLPMRSRLRHMRRPNIVMLVADNHGRGAVGSYEGGGDFETPNIDRLAAEGTRFTQFYCSNAFCSGSRATLLSGLLPSQHGVHSWLQDTQMDRWPEDWYAIGEVRTLPVTLQNRGYQTSHIGKWHLGTPWHPAPGFDNWTSLAIGDTLSFYDNQVVEEGVRRRVKDQHVVEYFTEQAVKRVEASDATEPFFLSVWYDGPYALPPTNMGADPRNPYYERMAAKTFDSVPRLRVAESIIQLLQLENFPNKWLQRYTWDLVRMQNDLPSLANFAAQCALVDEGVGRIVDAIDAAGLTEDTLVVYTTDQGNLFGQHGAWGHATSFVPSALYDELMCVPLICRQPGTVRADAVLHDLVGQYDIAPSITDWAGHGDVIYEGSPGRSFADLLRDGRDDVARDAVFYEQEETRAIRTPQHAYWKRRPELGAWWQEIGFPWEAAPTLYDMEADPDQQHDVAGDPSYHAIAADLDARLDRFFDDHATPRYDLWRGGTAKGSVEMEEPYRRHYGDGWATEAVNWPQFEEAPVT
jgi:arylsulfatase A-like enzyme